jgi:hypothetical protein
MPPWKASAGDATANAVPIAAAISQLRSLLVII